MTKPFTRLAASWAAGAALLVLAGCQTTIPLTWQLPEGLQTVQVNGYPMAYQEAGQGPVVVLVHGIWSDYRAMGSLQRGLSDRYRAVSVSLRHAYPEAWDGAGKTLSLSQHARDLAAFIGKLGTPVHLVGHSYGAGVALEVARARPELVSRLVLAEGGMVVDRPGEIDSGMMQMGKVIHQAEQLYKTSGTEAGLEFAVDALYGAGAWSRLPPIVKDMHRRNAWTFPALVRNGPPPTVGCDDFGRLKMPVLLMTGENTNPFNKALVSRQARCLPAARTATIPRVGHAVQGNASAVVAALKEFLQ